VFVRQIDTTGKSCQGQTLWLITKTRKLRANKFYSIVPWACFIELFSVVIKCYRHFNYGTLCHTIISCSSHLVHASMQCAAFHVVSRLTYSVQAAMQFTWVYRFPCCVHTPMHSWRFHAVLMQCACHHAMCMLSCNVHVIMQCACFHAVCVLSCSEHAPMQRACFHTKCWLTYS